MKVKKLIKTFFKGLLAVVMIIALSITMKVFLFASFKIPTSSMEPGIIPGDYILVNKLILGPRIYKNIAFQKSEKIEIVRLKGLGQVNRNDILVFNFPYPNPDKIEPDLNMHWVKRCIAIPGDTFFIENGIYKVAGYPDSLGIFHQQIALGQMADTEFLDEVFNCFPGDTLYNWNIKNFGPLYIPGKGDRIVLNTQNILLYKNLINYETNQEVTLEDGEIYLGSQLCPSYTFKQNYYFMSGDWIFDSQDSRYWGLLPEDLIIGKAVIIWKSIDPYSGEFKWKRFMKIIQ